MSLHQNKITETIVWLLKHGLIVQLHTYVTLGIGCPKKHEVMIFESSLIHSALFVDHISNTNRSLIAGF